jgi:hypothetical protein
MLTIASLSYLDGTWFVTPEEPATLPLILVALGTLAAYAVLTGWRPQRAMAAARSTDGADQGPITGETSGEAIRRAA